MTGRVHNASVVQPRWKEGKKERIDPVGCPDWRTALSTCDNWILSMVMPPTLETAIQASTTIMVIFKINWNRSVTSTPQSPPINVYIPVNGTRMRTQISKAVCAGGPRV